MKDRRTPQICICCKTNEIKRFEAKYCKACSRFLDRYYRQIITNKIKSLEQSIGLLNNHFKKIKELCQNVKNVEEKL